LDSIYFILFYFSGGFGYGYGASNFNYYNIFLININFYLGYGGCGGFFDGNNIY
jgi:hypothetical protein